MLDTHAQAVGRVLLAFADTHGRIGHFIEQAPRRMGALTEQALVQQRHLEQRDLQAHDQAPGVVGQALISGNLGK
ncbi:hypothetical protein D3C80_1059280 [compost metagenome]